MNRIIPPTRTPIARPVHTPILSTRLLGGRGRCLKLAMMYNREPKQRVENGMSLELLKECPYNTGVSVRKREEKKPAIGLSTSIPTLYAITTAARPKRLLTRWRLS